jgi:two-component system, cell cycle sensor histidine kinase and response regulator CckA
MTRALIVEDKEEGAYYLRALLEGHGWTVDSAHHGAEAIAKAWQALPDLVISDLLMPVMDGCTLLRNWKADARLKQVPFVVYTATYTEPEDERLALSLGADAFILKPAEPDDFLARILAVQAHAAATHATPPRTPVGEESALLRVHGQTLVRKLEEKMLQLEDTKRTLQQEEAELHLRDRAIQAVSQGIVITDPHLPDNPIVYASPGFERMTGYSAEELVGRNCRFLQGQETDRASTAKLGEAIREGRGSTAELLNYRKDGAPFWNNVTVSPVVDTSGAVTHFVGVLMDVTHRRQLETQLRQAQKMEAVGQLAAGVAHDFNNLLSVILSYAALVLEELKPGDSLRADVEEIRRAGERATGLTRQLLAFSRQQVLQPRVVDLGQLVLGVERMLRRLLGENVELSLLTQPSLGAVHADPGQVEQIVMNLALNARDAIPNGGKLTIETANAELDAVYVAGHHGVVPGPYGMLAIVDTGIGMDAATRERIFEPFFTTKEKGKGTGLGLSTVFGIVKQSQGHIWVLSEPDKGTTFKVYLPRADRSPQTLAKPPPAPATSRASETILLVEDDEQVLVMTRSILRRHGYNVLDAQNGGEASLISEQYASRIHLLLTDVVMPRMTGKVLAHRLLSRRPEMKVLFMSGYAANSASEGDALDVGGAFLRKPFTPDALLGRVRESLGTGPESARSAAG